MWIWSLTKETTSINLRRKQEAQRVTYRAPEYNVPPFWGIGQGGHYCLMIGPKNTNLVEDIEILHPIKFRWITFTVSEEKLKMSQPIRGQGGHLVFQISQKNTNLVADVKILLPAKFLWIPFSGFRGEVENVSANQRPGRPSCFSNRPKKHKLFFFFFFCVLSHEAHSNAHPDLQCRVPSVLISIS